MSEMKFTHRIIQDALPMEPGLKRNNGADLESLTPDVKSTHVMNVDANRLDDFFYVDCHWLWSGGSEKKIEVPHRHDFDEVICYVGSNQEDATDLGGEITIWLDDDKQVLKKTCLIFIPAGTRHGPVQYNRIDRPICYVTISPASKYSRSAVGDAAVSTSARDGDKPRYTIIDHTKERFTVAATGGDTPPPPPRNPNLRSKRILHLEDDMARGSFYVDFVWIYEGDGGAPAISHDHEWPELIAMAGCDPDNPHQLGGKMSIVMDEEDYVVDKSSMYCIPAHVDHCPWLFIGIEKPTLVFTAGPSAMYTGSHKKD